MALPKMDSKEWAEEVKFYHEATPSELAKRAELCGLKPMSYRRMMLARGVKKGERVTTKTAKAAEPEEKEPQIILPPIVLRNYIAKEQYEREEVVALHMSDGHAGKITKTFDETVYQKRMDNVFDSTMAIVTKHRKMYSLNKLWLPITGDNVQGENIFQGSKVGTIRMGARDQIAKLAFPAWVRLIGSLKQEFAEVVVDGWPGNHGTSREAPETSKEDLRLYDLLQMYFDTTKGVTFRIHEAEVGDNIVNILGFKFFCFHGDGIKTNGTLPFMAVEKRLKSWYMQFHGFNYALGGHWHTRHIDEISSECTYMMCGSLVSDDEWALKTMGISSNPSQNIYGIHHTRGVTWNYALCVDDEFIPEKIPEKITKEQRDAADKIEIKTVWYKGY
jgi:hypothetical protein